MTDGDPVVDPPLHHQCRKKWGGAVPSPLVASVRDRKQKRWAHNLRPLTCPTIVENGQGGYEAALFVLKRDGEGSYPPCCLPRRMSRRKESKNCGHTFVHPLSCSVRVNKEQEGS